MEKIVLPKFLNNPYLKFEEFVILQKVTGAKIIQEVKEILIKHGIYITENKVYEEIGEVPKWIDRFYLNGRRFFRKTQVEEYVEKLALRPIIKQKMLREIKTKLKERGIYV